jgi:dihydroxyacetone kinase
MKKILNTAETFVDDSIRGILQAHRQLVSVDGDLRTLKRSDSPVQGRVAIVTGGGSGHLPLFLGYVGPGLCSGVAIGNVFSSPSSDRILKVARSVDGGAGVLFLYGNYGGDVLNFDDAAEEAAALGMRVETALGTDDVLSGVEPARRRGIAGMVLVYKCVGASAERGDSIDDVIDVAREAVAATRTAGVGLSPTIFPATGEQSFDLPSGMMEVGIGIHGEPGSSRARIEPATEIARHLLEPVIDELRPGPNDEVALLVNGLGATPLEELYILAGEAHSILASTRATVHRTFVGEYVTSLEMAGASISVMRLSPRLRELLDAPAASPFVTF